MLHGRRFAPLLLLAFLSLAQPRLLCSQCRVGLSMVVVLIMVVAMMLLLLLLLCCTLDDNSLG